MKFLPACPASRAPNECEHDGPIVLASGHRSSPFALQPRSLGRGQSNSKLQQTISALRLGVQIARPPCAPSLQLNSESLYCPTEGVHPWLLVHAMLLATHHELSAVVLGSLVRRFFGSVVSRFGGFSVRWFLGSVVSRFGGFSVRWFLGSVVSLVRRFLWFQVDADREREWSAGASENRFTAGRVRLDGTTLRRFCCRAGAVCS